MDELTRAFSEKLDGLKPGTSVEEIRERARRSRVMRFGILSSSTVAALVAIAVAISSWAPSDRRIATGPAAGAEGSIVFTRFGSGIMTMNADGSDQHVVAASDQYAVDRPVWSPDGSKIAFHGFYGEANNESGGLFVMNADGSNRRLVELGGDAPVWSPDGRWIAFENHGVIRVTSAEGADRFLASAHEEADSPTWAPTSDRLAFRGCCREGDEIYSVEVPPARIDQLTEEEDDGASGTYSPAWSPDGSTIAHRRIRYDATTQTDSEALYLMAADGTGLERISDEYFFDGVPVWSPDGSEIAFAARRSGDDPSSIFVLPIGGQEQELAAGVSPAWSPDGTRIAFERIDGGVSHIYSINVDGTDLQQLTDGPQSDHSPDWGPPTTADQPTPAETQGGYVVGSDEVVMAFGSEGDIWLALSDGSVVNITQSPETESSPTISFDDQVLVYEREGRLVYHRLDTGESAEFADGYSPAFGPLDYLAWDSGAGEVVVGSPFSDWTVRAPNGPRGEGATSFSFAWDQSLELLYYSVAFGHGVDPHYIDIVRVDGWECSECGGGLELGRVRSLQPDDGTEGEFLSTSFGTTVDVLRVCCRQSDTDVWETAEIGGLDPFDTGTLYNRIRGLDDVPLDLSGTNLGLAHAGSLEATVKGDAVEWPVTDRNAWFVINGFDLWLLTDGRDPVLLPYKIRFGTVAVAPTFASSPLIHGF